MRLVALCSLPVVLAFASPSRLGRPPAVMQIRGGNEGHFFRELAPLWSSFTKAVKTHVEPVLKDPNRCILQPISKYAKQQAEEARKRQVHYQSAPREALGLVFLCPYRIIRASITALVLAEVVNYMGLLKDSQATTERVKNALKSANIESIQLKTQNLWKRARQQGGLLHAHTYTSPRATLATWQPKHQFAFGASFGLLTSQLFWALSSQILKTTVVVYALSELNELVKQQFGKSVTQHFKSTMSQQVESGLTRVRLVVRRSFQDPIHILETFPEMVDQYVPDGGLPISTRTGLAYGLIAGIMVP